MKTNESTRLLESERRVLVDARNLLHELAKTAETEQDAESFREAQYAINRAIPYGQRSRLT